MQFTIGVGVNNNHFEYWSTNYIGYTQCLTPVKNTKKCNELNVGGEVLNFLDEGGGVLKIKVLRLGAALKNVQYFCIYHPPPLPFIYFSGGLQPFASPAFNTIIYDFNYNLQLLKNTYCDVGLLNKNCLNE